VEYTLPKLNTCTSLYIIYHFSSISHERCTSEIEHFVLPYIIAYTFRSYSFVLPYITAYTSCSHSLYFLLDNFINFLALHEKVALPENEYLYFLSSSCVLPRVTGRTSLILRMILSFLQPFHGDSVLAKVEHMYFPPTLCVLPIFTVCTSQVEHPYFISSSGILPVVTVSSSYIFADVSIIFHVINWGLYT
jgi:hypothetical protein